MTAVYPSPPAYLPPPAPPPPRPPKPGRTAVLIFTVVLAVFLGGGVGAYFLVLDTQPPGRETPREAIDGFLEAVFTHNDPVRADDYVCLSEYDPERVDKLITQVMEAQAEFADPRTTWTVPDRLTVVRGKAELTVDLVLSDRGERATRQRLRLTVADQQGWWVCGNGPLQED